MNQPETKATFFQQLIDFTIKQALSCIFPVSIFFALAATQLVRIPGIHRYDMILFICLAVQAGMYFTKLETFDEIKVISLFHLFGLTLEIVKTKLGCWSYPEPGFTKILGVPLYSGFLYASVASYMCQAWRRLDLHLFDWPSGPFVWWLATAIYINFFSEHIIWDLRWYLVALVPIVFWKTRVRYTVAGVNRFMPLTLSFVLIAFFIWLAENISTFLHGWQYPDQAVTWNLVHTSKIMSWFLLVIISFICVAYLKHMKSKMRGMDDPIEFRPRADKGE